jgi:hypothetical protein
MPRRSEHINEVLMNIGSLNSRTIKEMHDGEMRFGTVQNKKQLRAQRVRLASVKAINPDGAEATDNSFVPPADMTQVEDRESMATLVDWEVRIVYQDMRLREVKKEAQQLGQPLPQEWVAYDARRLNGKPQPPAGLKE